MTYIMSCVWLDYMVKYFQCKNCVGSSPKTKKCVASFLVPVYNTKRSQLISINWLLFVCYNRTDCLFDTNAEVTALNYYRSERHREVYMSKKFIKTLQNYLCRAMDDAEILYARRNRRNDR